MSEKLKAPDFVSNPVLNVSTVISDLSAVPIVSIWSIHVLSLKQ